MGDRTIVPSLRINIGIHTRAAESPGIWRPSLFVAMVSSRMEGLGATSRNFGRMQFPGSDLDEKWSFRRGTMRGNPPYRSPSLRGHGGSEPEGVATSETLWRSTLAAWRPTPAVKPVLPPVVRTQLSNNMCGTVSPCHNRHPEALERCTELTNVESRPMLAGIGQHMSKFDRAKLGQVWPHASRCCPTSA